jgi:hypothetical protein
MSDTTHTWHALTNLKPSMDTAEAGRKGGKNRWAKATDDEKKEVGKQLAEARKKKKQDRLSDNNTNHDTKRN